jgi:hypothetical protein
MADADLVKAQADWIAKSTPRANEFVPEKNRGTWRSFTMKVRRSPGTGVQLSMRLVNAMGIERIVEPNEAAQEAAKELHNIYISMRQLTWEIIEVRFSSSPNPEDDANPKIGCTVTVDPDKNQAKKKA